MGKNNKEEEKEMRVTAFVCLALVAFAAADDLFKPEEELVLLEEEAQPTESKMWDPMMMGMYGMYNPMMMMMNPYMMMMNPYMMGMYGMMGNQGAANANHASFLEEEAEAEPSQTESKLYDPTMMMMGGMMNPYMMGMYGMMNPYMMMGMYNPMMMGMYGMF